MRFALGPTVVRTAFDLINQLFSAKNPLLVPSRGFKENGAGDEIRTHDIHLGKVTLYH